MEYSNWHPSYAEVDDDVDGVDDVGGNVECTCSIRVTG